MVFNFNQLRIIILIPFRDKKYIITYGASPSENIPDPRSL